MKTKINGFEQWRKMGKSLRSGVKHLAETIQQGNWSLLAVNVSILLPTVPLSRRFLADLISKTNYFLFYPFFFSNTKMKNGDWRRQKIWRISSCLVVRFITNTSVSFYLYTFSLYNYEIFYRFNSTSFSLIFSRLNFPFFSFSSRFIPILFTDSPHLIKGMPLNVSGAPCGFYFWRARLHSET